MMKEGVHLKPLESLCEDEPVWEEFPHLTERDIIDQSAATYKVIDSFDVFPASFSLAGNIIISKGQYQDGFDALYCVAAWINPLINGSEAPEKQPTIQTCNILFVYKR